MSLIENSLSLNVGGALISLCLGGGGIKVLGGGGKKGPGMTLVGFGLRLHQIHQFLKS